jgi:hypothetical protein
MVERILKKDPDIDIVGIYGLTPLKIGLNDYFMLINSLDEFYF